MWHFHPNPRGSQTVFGVPVQPPCTSLRRLDSWRSSKPLSPRRLSHSSVWCQVGGAFLPLQALLSVVWAQRWAHTLRRKPSHRWCPNCFDEQLWGVAFGLCATVNSQNGLAHSSQAARYVAHAFWRSDSSLPRRYGRRCRTKVQPVRTRGTVRGRSAERAE